MNTRALWGKFKQYLWNILIGVDHLTNTFFGGDPHETLSSRLWRNRDKRGVDILIFIVDGIFGKGHCQNSLEQSEMHVNEVIR